MLDWIVNIISSLGYLGIAFLMLLENFFPPISEEIIMPLAGFAAYRGELSFPFVILAGTTGTVIGAMFWYRIGQLVGEKRIKKWVEKHGKWLNLSGEDIDKSKKWFGKYGGIVVFFGRLIPGIRTYISIPAGFEEMPLLFFLLYSAAGSCLWVGVLTYAGFALGQNYQLVERFLGPVSTVVLVAFFFGLGVWLIRHRKSK